MKKIIITILIVLSSIATVNALTTKFKIDTEKLTFLKDGKTNSVLKSFDNKYNLKYEITKEDEKLKEEIENLTKTTTYLLLGDANKKDETSEEYYKRHQEYLKLRYNPEVPKDSTTFTGLDEKSEEYNDDLISGVTIPGIFLVFDELKVKYGSFGNIRITKTEKMIISTIYIPNVTLKEEDPTNPINYITKKTNLIIYYYYKKLNNEYKLYYVMGETTDELNEYFKTVEDEEKSTTMNIAPTYNSNLKEIYDYKKVEAITNAELNNIYTKTKDKIVTLNAYYNNYLTSSANGFFINEGIVVTTWNFLEKALKDAQFIAIKDSDNISYEIEGIITANKDTDIVLLKTKTKVNKKVQLGKSDILKTEDPVITINSKTGVGLTVQSGIIISNESYINTSIPIVEENEGSPLINKDGQIIGMNTAKQTNTSISIAINSNALEEIQNKFNTISFESIKAIPFKELKEKFYYVKYEEEIVKNNIPKNKWNEYSKIGSIKDTISLKLLKASYKDNVVSLRYYNNISEYIDNMNFALEFKSDLLKSGYKEIMTSSKKTIYQNKEYKVIIISEFDYLIIVMVKL